MKYIICLGDGMADESIEQLGGKTPLEYAKTEMMKAGITEYARRDRFSESDRWKYDK